MPWKKNKDEAWQDGHVNVDISGNLYTLLAAQGSLTVHDNTMNTRQARVTSKDSPPESYVLSKNAPQQFNNLFAWHFLKEFVLPVSPVLDLGTAYKVITHNPYFTTDESFKAIDAFAQIESPSEADRAAFKSDIGRRILALGTQNAQAQFTVSQGKGKKQKECYRYTGTDVSAHQEWQLSHSLEQLLSLRLREYFLSLITSSVEAPEASLKKLRDLKQSFEAANNTNGFTKYTDEIKLLGLLCDESAVRSEAPARAIRQLVILQRASPELMRMSCSVLKGGEAQAWKNLDQIGALKEYAQCLWGFQAVLTSSGAAEERKADDSDVEIQCKWVELIQSLEALRSFIPSMPSWHVDSAKPDKAILDQELQSVADNLPEGMRVVNKSSDKTPPDAIVGTGDPLLSEVPNVEELGLQVDRDKLLTDLGPFLKALTGLDRTLAETELTQPEERRSKAEQQCRTTINDLVTRLLGSTKRICPWRIQLLALRTQYEALKSKDQLGVPEGGAVDASLRAAGTTLKSMQAAIQQLLDQLHIDQLLEAFQALRSLAARGNTNDKSQEISTHFEQLLGGGVSEPLVNDEYLRFKLRIVSNAFADLHRSFQSESVSAIPASLAIEALCDQIKDLSRHYKMDETLVELTGGRVNLDGVFFVPAKPGNSSPEPPAHKNAKRRTQPVAKKDSLKDQKQALSGRLLLLGTGMHQLAQTVEASWNTYLRLPKGSEKDKAAEQLSDAIEKLNGLLDQKERGLHPRSNNAQNTSGIDAEISVIERELYLYDYLRVARQVLKDKGPTVATEHFQAVRDRMGKVMNFSKLDLDQKLAEKMGMTGLAMNREAAEDLLDKIEAKRHQMIDHRIGWVKRGWRAFKRDWRDASGWGKIGRVLRWVAMAAPIASILFPPALLITVPIALTAKFLSPERCHKMEKAYVRAFNRLSTLGRVGMVLATTVAAFGMIFLCATPASIAPLVGPLVGVVGNIAAGIATGMKAAAAAISAGLGMAAPSATAVAALTTAAQATVAVGAIAVVPNVVGRVAAKIGDAVSHCCSWVYRKLSSESASPRIDVMNPLEAAPAPAAVPAPAAAAAAARAAGPASAAAAAAAAAAARAAGPASGVYGTVGPFREVVGGSEGLRSLAKINYTIMAESNSSILGETHL